MKRLFKRALLVSLLVSIISALVPLTANAQTIHESAQMIHERGCNWIYNGNKTHICMLVPRTANTQTVIAQTNKHTTVHPYDSGGGCSSWVFFGNNTRFAQYQACISTWAVYFPNYDHELLADSYFTFGAANASFWTYCQIYLALENTQTGYVYGSNWDCLPEARSNGTEVHYGIQGNQYSIPNGNYYTDVFIAYRYNGDSSISYGPNVNSPVQNYTT